MKAASLTLVALGALIWCSLAGAADSLTVAHTTLPDNVHITGHYHIQNPSYCLPKQPPFGASNFDQWLNPRCSAYVDQDADFVVTVLHNGRKVYSDSIIGDGSFGSPDEGGTIDERIYVYELAGSSFNGCQSGDYYWTITLIDPFHRTPYNVSRRGGFHCG